MESCATSLVAQIFLGSLMIVAISIAIASVAATGMFVVGILKGKFFQ